MPTIRVYIQETGKSGNDKKYVSIYLTPDLTPTMILQSSIDCFKIKNLSILLWNRSIIASSCEKVLNDDKPLVSCFFVLLETRQPFYALMTMLFVVSEQKCKPDENAFKLVVVDNVASRDTRKTADAKYPTSRLDPSKRWAGSSTWENGATAWIGTIMHAVAIGKATTINDIVNFIKSEYLVSVDGNAVSDLELAIHFLRDSGFIRNASFPLVMTDKLPKIAPDGMSLK